MYPMNPLRVLYDGWPLCRHPNSPAALHLLAILAYLPKNIQPIIAFPETPPAWTPSDIQTHVETAPLDARLRWEQQTLPQLRQSLNAQLLHLTTETVSLFNSAHTVVSPTRLGDMVHSQRGSTPRRGLMTRLRAALAAGGIARARAIFWPEDLPSRPDMYPLPPVVHPTFTADDATDFRIPGVELPDTYVLYHGPEETTNLRRALEAWTWAAGPIGENYPLVLLGLGETARMEATALAASVGVRDTVILLPIIPPGWIPSLYRRAEVIFHPAEVPAWGGAMRHALACGKPLVGIETAWTDAIVGPAAILVTPTDTRRLGASVIGVIVKEELSARLQEAAVARSTGWSDGHWGEKLAEGYEKVLSY